MSTRKIVQIVRPQAVREGAGVTVHRTIGTAALRHLDPFLMLDHFSSDDPDDYIAGFPNHPHRGFVTLTYMLNGYMLHQDSMGNQGHLKTGGAQWMKAASGIIHSEMPKQEQGLMRGFQLWINLPAKEKMTAPEYQELMPEAITSIEHDGNSVRLLSGNYHGHIGPVHDPHTFLQYLDVQQSPGAVFKQQLDSQLQSFIYVFEGTISINDASLSQHQFAVFSPGDEWSIAAGAHGARFILVAARPIGEPIVQHGPFVMNTEAEIREAFVDYQSGQLVRERAAFHEKH